MEAVRKPFQGVRNIIRFNWQYYAISVILIIIGSVALNAFPNRFNSWIAFLIVLFVTLNLISILVSYFVYDLSGLYKFGWLKEFVVAPAKRIFNINAGYDETSGILKNHFSNAEITVYDFYDPDKHTEISIRRARKAYPPHPGTIHIPTHTIPAENSSAEFVFLILACHEIRDENERVLFFRELKRILNKNGRIIVVEHVRDMANLIAYNIGAFHFFSKRSWLRTFAAAGLTVVNTKKITPFITLFIINQDGNPHKD